MQTLKTLGLAAALTALAASGAFAQATTQSLTLTAAAANTPGDSSGATAQVGTTSSNVNTKYLDVEGSGNSPKFETFGVVDFFSNTIADANGNTEVVTSVDPSITLDFADQAFPSTRPGNLNFYLADGNAALSALRYDTTDTSATGGVGSQLGNLYSLGQAAYTSTSRTPAPGDDPFTLTLSDAAQSLFIQQINQNGGNLRFVVTADPSTPNIVGSFAGALGGSAGPPYGSPSVSFTVTGASAPVPEASTTVSLGLLLVLGLGGVAAARRRQAQA